MNWRNHNGAANLIWFLPQRPAQSQICLKSVPWVWDWQSVITQRGQLLCLSKIGKVCRKSFFLRRDPQAFMLWPKEYLWSLLIKTNRQQRSGFADIVNFRLVYFKAIGFLEKDNIGASINLTIMPNIHLYKSKKIINDFYNY